MNLLGQQDDLPSLKVMLQQLGIGSLGGGGGSTMNLLPQATGILRPLARQAQGLTWWG